MTEIYLDGSEAMLIKIGWDLWDKPCDTVLVFWSGRMICSTTKLDRVLVRTEGS